MITTEQIVASTKAALNSALAISNEPSFSNLWLKKQLLTHVTCMKSLQRLALKLARLLKPRPLKLKSNSLAFSMLL